MSEINVKLLFLKEYLKKTFLEGENQVELLNIKKLFAYANFNSKACKRQFISAS
jgi:hypothetical protein